MPKTDKDKSVSAKTKAAKAPEPACWETVSDDYISGVEAGKTMRLAVPGGWLYRTNVTHRRQGQVVACSESLAFVPTPARV